MVGSHPFEGEDEVVTRTFVYRFQQEVKGFLGYNPIRDYQKKQYLSYPPEKKMSQQEPYRPDESEVVGKLEQIASEDESIALWVDKYRVMNYRTETTLYGSQLRDGMIVLAADFNRRQSARGASTKDDVRALLMVKNRFCRVSQIRYNDPDKIHFIGVYADGSEYKRDCHPYDGWVVKRYSIPGEIEASEER